jgi:hypothetical protein
LSGAKGPVSGMFGRTKGGLERRSEVKSTV